MSSTAGRQYKSRRIRPCDFCRGRKQACHMEQGPPCRLCKERQRTCTFVEAPGKRTRPGADSNPKDDTTAQASGCTAAEVQAEAWPASRDPLSPRSQGFNTDIRHSEDNGEDSHVQDVFPNPDITLDALMNRGLSYLDDGIYDALLTSPPNDDLFMIDVPNRSNTNIGLQNAASHSLPVSTHSRPSSQLIESSTGSPRSPFDRSLDGSSDVYYRAIGFTGDLDLYVLSHRQYNDHDESSVQYKGLRYRRVSSRILDAPIGTPLSTQSPGQPLIPPLVFTLIDNEFAAGSEPRLDSKDIEGAKEALKNTISPRLGYRLSLLYAHYVHPNFPILSSRQLPKRPEDVPTVPLPLLAAIIATALPFITYDDVLSVWLPQCPSESELFRIAWILATEELHTPRLSTIQTCLLILQRHATNRYVPSTPFRPALMSTTVTLCHCLGLHRDPSTWTSLPKWERQLRRRLWWATWTMEKWITLGESVPSALTDDDFDVEPLNEEDIDENVSHQLEFDPPRSHFPYLVSLTGILAEVVRTFFTVRSAARTSTNLEISLEAAKPLRAKLKQWHDALPSDIRSHVSPFMDSGNTREGARQMSSSSFCRLNACGSFYLAYLTAQMTLFRALLRPVSVIATLSVKSKSTVVSSEAVVEYSGSNYQIPEDQVDAMKAVIKGALAVVKEVVQFAENLGGSEWDAFWHSWSRTNFAIMACIMLNLVFILRPPIWAAKRRTEPNSTQSPSDPTSPPMQQPSQQRRHPEERRSPNTDSFLNLQDDYKTLLDYLTRWRWAMKISSRGAGGRKGLMNLSLLRLDALLSELSNSSSAENPDESRLS